MKKRTFIFRAAAGVALVALGTVWLRAQTNSATEDPFDVLIRDDVVFAQQQLTKTVNSIATNRYPIYTNPTGAWETTSSSDWTPGFFPGSLWFMYQQTFDGYWKTQAERWLGALQGQASVSASDLGFMIFNSFGNGYRLTGNDAYRQVVLTAAGTLAGRYSPAVGCFRSRSHPTDFTVIVDAMMNLEVMFWAASHGGDPIWYDWAVRHALKTMEAHVRPDGSTWQIVNFDSQTGAVRSRQAQQGFSVNTTWSRGQAWGLYGFTVSYRETGDLRFLDTARKLADYYLAHLPSDMIPYWDFQAPNIPNEPRDTSAAAIGLPASWNSPGWNPTPAVARGI
jgi:unsaturated chondroitin disaccharide hydrolase